MSNTRVINVCAWCKKEFSVHISHRTQLHYSHRCDRARRHPPLHERFFAKVQKTEGCWLWTAGVNAGGYGTFRVPERGRSLLAHRYSYEFHTGQVVGDLFVCHHCDNPRCVNPAHLFIGTALDNNRDMFQKGRDWKGARPKGEAHGMARLTAQEVAAIRQRLSAGTPRRELMREFSVSPSNMSRIARGQSWK